MTRFRGFQKYAYKRQKPGYYLKDFLKTKNPLVLFGSKKFVLGIVVLSLIIGGIVLYQGPLFHSTMSNPDYHKEDPTTVLWSDNYGSTANWKVTSNVITCVSCGGTGDSGFKVGSSGKAAVALTTINVGQLSLASGKNLDVIMYYVPDNAGDLDSVQWGWFLTTNATLPTDLNYNPGFDSSVFMFAFVDAGSSGLTHLYIKHNPTDTIASEAVNSCAGISNACFITATQSPTANVPNDLSVSLNYTGTANAGGANGISYICLGSPIGCGTPHTTTELPDLSLTLPYYLGLWEISTTHTPIDWLNLFLSPDVNVFIPAANPIAPPSTIDTGGFFGPIIRALISLGVFILANIISFGNYLAGLMGPVWAFLGGLAATVLNGLSSIIITLINDLGSLIGDPNLGNQLVSVFTQIGSYITGLFGAIGNIVGNLITFIQNAMTFLFDSVNGVLTYWIGTVLFGILGVLVTISGLIVTVLKVFQVAFPFVVLADLLWLLSESVDHGTEGAMKWWQPHEILVVNVGKLMFVLVETLSTFVFQTITEIEGGAADIKPELAGFSP